jgi:hypothetical protein
MNKLQLAASALGSIKTEAKAKSSRENGKIGGRPRQSTPMDLTGKRFGKITVITISNYELGKGVRWDCKCDCGKEFSTLGINLRTGNTKSCGCLKIESLKTTVREKITKHGHCAGGRNSRAYQVWAGMIDRCSRASHEAYENYGGRGIKVCERWLHSFENFLADMGEKPTPKHSLDRFPNNDGNYEPSNCRWATKSQQQFNRRTTPKMLAHYKKMRDAKRK